MSVALACAEGSKHTFPDSLVSCLPLRLHLWLPPGLLTILMRERGGVPKASIALPVSHSLLITRSGECFSPSLRVSQKFICPFLRTWLWCTGHSYGNLFMNWGWVSSSHPCLSWKWGHGDPEEAEQVKVVPLSSAELQYRDESSPTLTSGMIDPVLF